MFPGQISYLGKIPELVCVQQELLQTRPVSIDLIRDEEQRAVALIDRLDVTVTPPQGDTVKHHEQNQGEMNPECWESKKKKKKKKTGNGESAPEQLVSITIYRSHAHKHAIINTSRSTSAVFFPLFSPFSQHLSRKAEKSPVCLLVSGYMSV
ncbi:hypothetical protein PO909_019921 [Leuciscus waleckii]